MSETGIIKITQHSRGIGGLHGEIMVRALPAFVLGTVALGTGFAADIFTVTATLTGTPGMPR